MSLRNISDLIEKQQNDLLFEIKKYQQQNDPPLEIKKDAQPPPPPQKANDNDLFTMKCYKKPKKQMTPALKSIEEEIKVCKNWLRGVCETPTRCQRNGYLHQRIDAPCRGGPNGGPCTRIGDCKYAQCEHYTWE
tara:strand:+ start:542 stop:943 length:402 start_codon:yes stop_codon:yes gene_type:complete